MDRIAHFWVCSEGCPPFKTITRPKVCPHCENPYLTPLRDAELRDFEEFENEAVITEFDE